jgi:hypothetical protein
MAQKFPFYRKNGTTNHIIKQSIGMIAKTPIIVSTQSRPSSGLGGGIGFLILVPPAGFEPASHRLKGVCWASQLRRIGLHLNYDSYYITDHSACQPLPPGLHLRS